MITSRYVKFYQSQMSHLYEYQVPAVPVYQDTCGTLGANHGKVLSTMGEWSPYNMEEMTSLDGRAFAPP